jgi:outer membrane protein, heavy metal efflux system
VRLAQSSIDLAQNAQRAAQKRVEAGKVSPVEATKAGIALAGARVDYARAESALKSSKKRLATAMDLAWPLWLQLRNYMVVMCLQAAKIWLL